MLSNGHKLGRLLLSRPKQFNRVLTCQKSNSFDCYSFNLKCANLSTTTSLHNIFKKDENSNKSNNPTSKDDLTKPKSLFDLDGYKKYVVGLKKTPGSHLTSFLILHELTAVFPLLVVFTTLTYTGIQPLNLSELSPEATEAATKSARYVLSKVFGYEAESLNLGSPIFTNLIISYFLVKFLAPARVILSAALTPWFSLRVTHPIYNLVKRYIKSK